MVPTTKQVVDALTARGVDLNCKSCQGGDAIKLEVVGLNTTTLVPGAVNTQTTLGRWVPVAMIYCSVCGELRAHHLEWLGFPPPY